MKKFFETIEMIIEAISDAQYAAFLARSGQVAKAKEIYEEATP